MDTTRFTSLRMKTWDEIFLHVRTFKDGWIFRGQPSDYPLASSLERACKRAGVSLSRARDTEYRLVREFQRRFHFYSVRAPNSDSILEWLAIMQHHGAPTRLLDWTYSLFVAAYFAVESAETDSVVWALNTDWLKDEIGKNPRLADSWREFVSARTADSFRLLFLRESPEAFVYTATPLEMNERLAVQQGLFLCPGDISRPFAANLEALSPSSSSLVRITIPLECRTQALRDLQRMNMNAATLFPGLDGFARSMWTRLEHLSAVPIKV